MIKLEGNSRIKKEKQKEFTVEGKRCLDQTEW